MPRSVNHVASKARRKKILKLTRGYFGARKNVWTVAKNTWEKGLTYAFRDRRNKKRNFRALWIQRINAAARLEGMSYSKLMGGLHKAGIEINRKVLADLAMNHPEAFKAVVAKAKDLQSVSYRSDNWHFSFVRRRERMKKNVSGRTNSFFFLLFSENLITFVIEKY